MHEPPASSPVPEAPTEALPSLLADPPWTWDPIVIEGLEPPEAPPVVIWPEYDNRESWASEAPSPPSGGKHDWNATAERIRSGRALTELKAPGRALLYTRLLVHGPDDLAAEALADRRYWDDLTPKQVRAIVARHELAAYSLALHTAGDDFDRLLCVRPFLDAETTRLKLERTAVKHLTLSSLDPWNTDYWFEHFEAAAVPFLLPYALGGLGRLRDRARRALHLIARRTGHDVLVEAARPYGEEAVRALEPLRYPAEVPGADLPLDRLPRVLLRDRAEALPASAVRHLVSLLLWSRPGAPAHGVEEVIEACDPRSLPAFAWALYETEAESPAPQARLPRRTWTHPGVQYALGRLGDEGTAAALAEIVVRWSSKHALRHRGRTVFEVFVEIGGDAMPRLLDRIAREAADHEVIAPAARSAMRTLAERLGLDERGMAARLIPDLGLDAQGGITLDYGPRSFRVGFDEQLRPYVTDGSGRRRPGLPRPGARDDKALATAARAHYTKVREQVSAIAREQIGRLEEAMVTGETWSVEGWRALYLDHPVLWLIARRLVWSVEGRTFRIAEDRSLADADDKPFALPPEGRVALPHPLLLGDELAAWAELFADYEILQPFAQLGRPVHRLTEEERADHDLERFCDAEVPYEALARLTKRGWRWPRTPVPGRSTIIRRFPSGHVVRLRFIPNLKPPVSDSATMLTISGVQLRKESPMGEVIPFGELDPVFASEFLTDLTELITETGNQN